MMKKKIVLGCTGIILTAVGTAALLHFRPRILFEQGNNVAWNILRSVFLSGIIICLFMVGVIVFQERKKISPYIKKFIKFQPLLHQLVRRDFFAKYKRSVLGVLWSLLNPLLTMMVLAIVFSSLFRFDIENFPVYMLSGQIIFTMYSEITNMCMSSVIGAAALMKKVNVPKYIFPLSRAFSSLINFAFSFLALVLVMVATKAPFHLTMLFTPIAISYTFAFSTGVGLMLSALMVFFRDISYLYGIFMTAVMYFTPLFYPVSVIPDKFRWIVSLNPLYHFVSYFRTCAIYGVYPSAWQNIICASLSLMALCMGLLVFNRKQDQFILYI